MSTQDDSRPSVPVPCPVMSFVGAQENLVLSWGPLCGVLTVDCLSQLFYSGLGLVFTQMGTQDHILISLSVCLPCFPSLPYPPPPFKSSENQKLNLKENVPMDDGSCL